MSTNDQNIYHYWWLLAAVGLFLCLPVLTVKYVPLVDYPNHLARAFILAHYTDVPAYALTYDRSFEPIPNLALDLIVPALSRFVGIIAAGKIFLTITILLFVMGCHLLGKAIHGRPTWLALPCCFFVYNSMLLYGFVNYVFGVGMFCISFAWWLKWREKWTIARVLFAALLVFCSYLAHLSAYSFLGVSFVVVTGWNFWKKRETLRAALIGFVPLLPPLISFVAFMRNDGQSSSVAWNTVGRKLVGMLALFLTYNYTIDLLVMLALAGIVVVLIRRTESVDVVWPLFIAGGVFALLYLICPMVIFTSSAADTRFILPAAVLLVLSLKWNITVKAGKGLLLASLLLFSIHVCSIWSMWAVLDRRIGAEVERLEALPDGARVFPMPVMPKSLQEAKVARAFGHIVHYATIERHLLVPSLFARRGQQPLVFRTRPQYEEPENNYSEQWQEYAYQWQQYDYVWCYGTDEALERLLRERCRKVNEGDGFSLWQVN
ncbi:MAG: hypothetical protein ABR577_11870 [Pyrinomonadaceae bacterium]